MVIRNSVILKIFSKFKAKLDLHSLVLSVLRSSESEVECIEGYSEPVIRSFDTFFSRNTLKKHSGRADHENLPKVPENIWMINKKSSMLMLSLFCVNFLFSEANPDNFIDSFIDKYDLESKYTREYHPYTLKKTANSFLQLREFIKQNQIKVDHDILIIGYQEDGMPPYTSSWDREDIHDEAILKNNSGSEKSARNMFGFLTGFVLKDANWLEKKWHPDSPAIFEHVHAKNINFFDDNNVVFQKHALDKDFDYIIQIRNEIERKIYSKDPVACLSSIVDFWKFLFEKSCKSGFGNNIATQDILFSTEYASMLVKGKCNIKKIFVGPDITYPIETLSIQKAGATANAQKFITEFEKYIKPIEDKNTAYIFGSFVDGVGKSTLLNNIQNWQKYSDQFEKYERCDNSSSQEATVYKLKDKLFLVDLPAQISHFTIKPEGFVYSDVSTKKDLQEHDINKILKFVSENREKLIENFEHLKNQVIRENLELYSNNSNNTNNSDSNIEYHFAQQVVNLNKLDQDWVPFEFENSHYIFNKKENKTLKILVPLATTHSTGLKNAVPEQMLFVKGLSLPLSYKDFMQILIDKMKAQGIERVVFVNFLSMYPRTSRENIRVNFILQYAKKLFKDRFDIENSFYKIMVHREAENYKLLNDCRAKLAENLVIETALRLSMYNILEKHAGESLNLISGKTLEKDLKSEVQRVIAAQGEDILKHVQEKLSKEHELRDSQYALDKVYNILLKFDSKKLLDLNNKIVNLFQNYINHEYYSSIWSGMDGEIPDTSYKNQIKRGSELILTNGVKTTVVGVMHESCQDFEQFQNFVTPIRAQWYGIISQLVYCKSENGQFLVPEKIPYGVPPLIIKRDKSGYLYALEKRLPIVDLSENKDKYKPIEKFHIIESKKKQRKWGIHKDIAHCMDWSNPGTFFMLYAYTYTPVEDDQNIITDLVTDHQMEAFLANKGNIAMSTSELLKKIEEKNLWQKLEKELDSSASSNKNLLSQKHSVKEILDDNADSENSTDNSGAKETISTDSDRIAGIKLFIKLIVELESTLKDINSHVIVRSENKEDMLASSKLIEKIVLPKYFDIKISGDIFE